MVTTAASRALFIVRPLRSTPALTDVSSVTVVRSSVLGTGTVRRPRPTVCDAGAVSDRTVVLLLSGPNLNLLGERDPAIYGTATLDDHVATATAAAAAAGLGLEHVQSNHEGVLIDAIHGARGRCAAIVVNPGALTHYAWSLHDALEVFDGPVVELHLSDPKQREPWRHLSVVEPVADRTVAGLGGDGYRVAVEAVVELLARP
jgi:3-dehydroquinate dehydratase-2